jgi:hypothetical protein
MVRRVDGLSLVQLDVPDRQRRLPGADAIDTALQAALQRRRRSIESKLNAG